MDHKELKKLNEAMRTLRKYGYICEDTVSTDRPRAEKNDAEWIADRRRPLSEEEIAEWVAEKIHWDNPEELLDPDSGEVVIPPRHEGEPEINIVVDDDKLTFFVKFTEKASTMNNDKWGLNRGWREVQDIIDNH